MQKSTAAVHAARPSCGWPWCDPFSDPATPSSRAPARERPRHTNLGAAMGCCCSSCIPAKKQAAVVPIQSEWADAPTSSVLPRDDYRGKRSCLVGFMLWGMAGPGKVDYTDVPKAREKIDAAFKVPPGGIPAFKQWRELCDVEDITIAGGGGQDMVVTRIKPKKLKDTKGLAGFVNCHGGGAIMLKPEHETDWWCRMCVEADVVRYAAVPLLCCAALRAAAAATAAAATPVLSR
jgi:hypothetical protein